MIINRERAVVGGASMSYIAVLFWGTPCAVIGALVTGPITRVLGVSIDQGKDRL